MIWRQVSKRAMDAAPTRRSRPTKNASPIRAELSRTRLERIPSEPWHVRISVGLREEESGVVYSSEGGVNGGRCADWQGQDMAKRNPALFIPVKVG